MRCRELRFLFPDHGYPRSDPVTQRIAVGRGKGWLLVLAVLILACLGLDQSDGGSSKKKGKKPKTEEKKEVVDDKKDGKKEDKKKEERKKPVERDYITRLELDADGAYARTASLTEKDFTED